MKKLFALLALVVVVVMTSCDKLVEIGVLFCLSQQSTSLK